MPSNYLERASVERFVTVCAAAGFKAIVITPQLVLIVIVFASFLSGVLGCFTVAGSCAFEVGLAQPATDVGRSAADAVAPVNVNDAAVIARAQITLFIFIVEFLLPFDCSWWLASDIQNYTIYLTNLIGNSC